MCRDPLYDDAVFTRKTQLYIETIKNGLKLN